MLCNRWSHWRRIGATVLLAFSAVLIGAAGLHAGNVQAKSWFAPAAAPDAVAIDQLPPQARSVLTLIHQGGPFRHDKDGVVFGNRERLLPAHPRAYYREYTVRTPGERSRGARRIVCGGLQPSAPDACFYTDDHYASFRRIVH